MAIQYYDEALTKKIQGWIPDNKLKVLSPQDSSRLFGMIADQTGDKPIKLPLIALSRASDVELDNPHKKPLSFDGAMIGSTKTYSYQLDAIKMRLRYQLDIYTRYAEEAEEFVRNFVFNLVNNPTIKIELPYNGTHLEHVSNVDIDSTITDNSDIPQRLFSDQFTRWTINLEIADAYMFSIPKYDNLTASLEYIELTNSKGEEDGDGLEHI